MVPYIYTHTHTQVKNFHRLQDFFLHNFFLLFLFYIYTPFFWNFSTFDNNFINFYSENFDKTFVKISLKLFFLWAKLLHFSWFFITFYHSLMFESLSQANFKRNSINFFLFSLHFEAMKNFFTTSIFLLHSNFDQKLSRKLEILTLIV